MNLEMTGLDATRDVIVKIATIVTDDDLNIVAEGPDLVIHQDDEALAVMDPFVVDMHTRSGLLDAIRASTISLSAAGAATLAFIKQHAPVQGSVPLCGNSIGMDRRFSPPISRRSRTGCTTAASTCRVSKSSFAGGIRR